MTSSLLAVRYARPDRTVRGSWRYRQWLRAFLESFDKFCREDAELSGELEDVKCGASLFHFKALNPKWNPRRFSIDHDLSHRLPNARNRVIAWTLDYTCRFPTGMPLFVVVKKRHCRDSACDRCEAPGMSMLAKFVQTSRRLVDPNFKTLVERY